MEKMKAAPELPKLKMCTYDHSSNTLSVPRDIRDRWLTDPVRSLDWKQVLRRFDSCHLADQPVTDGQEQKTQDDQISPVTTFDDEPTHIE